ncbi:MAG: glycine dehydrogenase, partial [Bacteriovoracales bacterium]|nr:glycine dehydrogenase [Bacteriovoracales bacterium]
YAASLPGFTDIPPQAPEADCQGSLRVLYEIQENFKRITGLEGVATQPVAGAQGELMGLKMFQAYHRDRGEKRDVLLIPRSAHGTNPATATTAGFESIVWVEAMDDGLADFDQLQSLVEQYGDRVCGIMMTNPNTSGVFEERFHDISALIHEAGGLVYMDGANMNALASWVNLAKLGVDAVHNNLHKTWAIPHGGGGPGDAIVAVSKALTDYLPGVQVVGRDGVYRTVRPPRSIGSFHRHYGNFAHKVRALTYLKRLGSEGIRLMSGTATLCSRYLCQKLKESYLTLPKDDNRPVMHEFILTLSREEFSAIEKVGIPKAQIIARVGKLFLDYGLHAPTVAFPEPLGLMVEPTESFTKGELDRFVHVSKSIKKLITEHPEVLQTVPHFTPIDRVDETWANRNLCFSGPLDKLPDILENRLGPHELSSMTVEEITERIILAHGESVHSRERIL